MNEISSIIKIFTKRCNNGTPFYLQFLRIIWPLVAFVNYLNIMAIVAVSLIIGCMIAQIIEQRNLNIEKPLLAFLLITAFFAYIDVYTNLFNRFFVIGTMLALMPIAMLLIGVEVSRNRGDNSTIRPYDISLLGLVLLVDSIICINSMVQHRLLIGYLTWSYPILLFGVASSDSKYVLKRLCVYTLILFVAICFITLCSYGFQFFNGVLNYV